MLEVHEIIIVEGKHDIITLSGFIRGTFFATNGFRIFKDSDRMGLLRQLAKERGVVILTDSDGAGLVIRRYLTGALPDVGIKQAYIPQIIGKEKRKTVPSKEGFLGVEGQSEAILKKALSDAGVTVGDQYVEKTPWMTKSRLYEDGLCGHADSEKKRRALLEYFQLPLNLTTKRMLEWMNTAISEETYQYVLETVICSL